jgi:hypothetical protein
MYLSIVIVADIAIVVVADFALTVLLHYIPDNNKNSKKYTRTFKSNTESINNITDQLRKFFAKTMQLHSRTVP